MLYCDVCLCKFMGIPFVFFRYSCDSINPEEEHFASGYSFACSETCRVEEAPLLRCGLK